jgi:membrane peptidoglycan carboxypeptidase
MTGGTGGSTSGRAQVGRASVGGGGATGSAGVGRVSVGRAGVGGPDADRTGGRARVPSQSGTAGRATVGRASVRVGSPEAAGADVIRGPGGGRRPPANPRSKSSARAKRARRRNWILGSFALLLLIAGSTVVGGTYFYDNVALPNELPQRAQATTIFFSDNKTPMGKIGSENRTIIPPDQIPKHVRNAVVAAEDADFYHNSGISYTGIARAFWNNMTGGEKQGASTITQQYARAIADLKGITYSRKMREAVLAMKLSKEYDKDTLLTAYLNTVYFGRQAYGIEAAAQAYFGKNAKDLTVEEGMALAIMIKQPAAPGGGLGPYDFTAHPDTTMDRFTNYIVPMMVKTKAMTPEQAATIKYPAVRKYDPSDPAYAAEWGKNKPTGNILHNVVDEMTHLTDPTGKLMFPDLKTGGYRIVTTIDKDMQDAAEKYAGGDSKDSPIFGQQNAVAAMVAVEPYSGRVKAYYGGPNGGEQDRAGVWRDTVLTDDTTDRLQGFGRHAPASSFKIYALGAAMREGYSLNTYWDGTSPKTFPGRQKAVENAEGKTQCAAGDKHCTLREATVESLNVPFYSLATKLDETEKTKKNGQDKVLQFARDAGIRYAWNTEVQDANKQRMDLSANIPVMSGEVGFGQYPITVLDHANGVATMAARGARAQSHFVAQVYKGAALVYREPFKPTQIPGFSQQMADDINSALQQVLQVGTGKNLQLAGNRAAAAKTGTWQAELDETGKNTVKGQNSNAWMVGFVAPDLSKKPQFYGLATAVWVGSKVGDSAALKIKGANIFGSTAGGPIWKKFMDAATANMPKTQFPKAKDIGDATLGDTEAPAITPQPGQPADPNNPLCQQFPLLCGGTPGQGAGSPGSPPGNGNGNGGGQGGGAALPPPQPTPTRRR